jgi:hypothetical protein
MLGDHRLVVVLVKEEPGVGKIVGWTGHDMSKRIAPEDLPNPQLPRVNAYSSAAGNVNTKLAVDAPTRALRT